MTYPAAARLISAVLAQSSWMVRRPAAVPVNTSGWPLFRDARTGLTFRYPPSLRIRLRNRKDFGLPDAALIVDVDGDTEMNPGSIVLWFIVDRGNPTQDSVATRVRSLRSGCRSLTTMTIDAHPAFVCVYCGRAA